MAVIERVRQAAAALAMKIAGTAAAPRVYAYSPQLDDLRNVTGKSITYTKMQSILEGGDDGEITETLKLFEFMERRDPRLRAVLRTRRRAVTGLPYEIVSAADVEDNVSDKTLADEAADYVRQHLPKVVGLRDGLKHLAQAIGTNLAVLEQVWAYGELAELVRIPSSRLTMKTQESLDIRVITDEDRTYGVPARGFKWVVHVPECVTGIATSESLLQAVATVWLLKKLAMADWGTFSEMFGMPIRVGKYSSGASSEEKKKLREFLQGMSAKAWATISQNASIEFVERTGGGTAPYAELKAACDREMAILVLGGNLTSDTTGGTGTFAAAEVQDRVRDEVQDDDLANEARTVEEQIFAPMVAMKFPGTEAPVPRFQRLKPEKFKPEEVLAWQKTGLPISREWAYKASGIPEPGEGEEPLEPGLDAFASGVNENNARGA